MKISEIPKMHENFLRKFPENFPENSRKIRPFFVVKMECYRAKIYLFITSDVMKIQENFGKISGKFPKCQKFPEEISPENFPEIPGVFFGEMQCYRA